MSAHRSDPTPEQPSSEAQVEPKQNWLKNFRTKHPRTAKVAGFTAGAVAITVGVNVVKNLSHNRNKLAEAKDQAAEVVDTLADAASNPEPAA